MSDGIWGYQPTAGHTAGTDLIGYKVEATDGTIGKVDKHSDEVGSAYLVVDTGVWIFGKHVMLPAGTVRTVDSAERKIHVELTKEQIKNSRNSTRTATPGTRSTTTSWAVTTAATARCERPVRRSGGVPDSFPVRPYFRGLPWGDFAGHDPGTEQSRRKKRGRHGIVRERAHGRSGVGAAGVPRGCSGRGSRCTRRTC